MLSSPLRGRAILFDLDGVLIDSRVCVELVLRAWAAVRGIDADLVLREAHGRRTVDTVAVVAPHLDPVAEAVVLDQMEEAERRGEFPFHGVADFVSGLPDGQWAIVTSGVQPVVGRRIRVAGVPVPRVLITARDVRRGKPDPEGYLAAASRLGVPAHECIVIEDAPAGIAAASAAGMPTIAVLTTHQREELATATLVVARIVDLSVRLDQEGWLEVRRKQGEQDGREQRR